MQAYWRKQKNYHILDYNSWIHNCVNELISKNIGNEYCLVDRVTVLKYEVGDFFLKHKDGPYNTQLNSNLPNHFYGGVELSERYEFTGGDFFINDKNVDWWPNRHWRRALNLERGNFARRDSYGNCLGWASSWNDERVGVVGGRKGCWRAQGWGGASWNEQ